METLDDLMFTRAPTARRPLLGLTVLIVEDSRFASEALRMMCLRSGARIRRADSLENAHRHLAIYRPNILLVDVGLPDGSGAALLRSVAEAAPRIDVILGISGDPDAETAVMEAGADGFMTKPINGLFAFQSGILAHLPADRQPPSPRVMSDETILPDRIAYRDDLSLVAQILKEKDEESSLDYVTQFLGGVARSAQDHDLDAAVTSLAQTRDSGGNPAREVAALSQMVETRIAAVGPL